jgi:hypothetical protein
MSATPVGFHRVGTFHLAGRRVGLLVLGATMLVGFVLAGAISQAGLVQCAVCHGNVCGPETQVCPGSLAAVGVFIAALAIAAVVVALGLGTQFPFAVRWGQRGRPNGVSLNALRPTTEFLAAFVTFFGWALLAWGLLLPWSVFGTCYYGPCQYPYVLQGIPLDLAVSGAAMIALGGSLMALLSRRRAPSDPK